ncbi:MAG: hypothetical protein Q7S50_01445 [bacterium]|nr:hypothetical protein [bacterium]
MGKVVARPAASPDGDEVGKFVGIAMNGSDEEEFAASIERNKRERGKISVAAQKSIRLIDRSVKDINVVLGTQK